MKALTMLVAVLLVTGCGGIPGGSVKPNTATPAASGAQPTATHQSAEDVVMCELMPLGDVQAKSPFQTALADALEDTMRTGCTYRAAIDAEEPVSILLSVTTFDSPADANTSLQNHRQFIVDQGLAVSDISGLGDAAFSAGSDEVGVHAVTGPSVIDANFKGEWPDTTDDAKVVAGTELVRTILSRLP